jgi:predicted permease
VNDLRYVLRTLRRSPAFTAIAIVSLALGIGANAAVFSVIRSLLLDPLPVANPDELAMVYWSPPSRRGAISGLELSSSSQQDRATGLSYNSNYSYPAYLSLIKAAGTSTEVFGFNFLPNLVVSFDNRPSVIIGGAAADGRYFAALRVAMALGRSIGPADDRPGGPWVAVISHRCWRRTFGGDPAIVGRSVRVNGVPVEIVGVSADRFTGLTKGGFFEQPDITLPLTSLPALWPSPLSNREALFSADNIYWVRVMARVAAGTDRRALEQRLTPVFHQHLSAQAVQDPTPPAIALLPGARGHEVARPDTQRMLFVLSGVAGLILLIACANLASLILARGASRQRELSVRRALGANRSQLIRLLVVESLVLAFAGAAFGMAVAAWSRDGLSAIMTTAFGTSGFGRLPLEVTIDFRLILAAAAAAGLTAVLIALVPALRLTRAQALPDLKHAVAGSSRPRLGVGRVLIAVQIAVSMPLVAGAVLFLKTMSNLAAVELGFDPRGLVLFKLDPSSAGLAQDAYPRLYSEVLTRLAALPGVRTASLIENPLASGLTSGASVTVDGAERRVLLNAVGPDFVETMGLRLIAGRAIGVSDVPGTPRVAMVNESAVRVLFGGAWPIGRHLRSGRSDIEIIGVVSDTRYRDRRTDIQPVLFNSALQRAGYAGHHVVIRTTSPPASLETAILQAVAAVNRQLAVPSLRTHTAGIDETTARERVFTQVLTLFGAFSLLLAGIGLYGITAYSVARRTSEIGLRVALGSRPDQVLWLFVRQVAWLALIGVALGVPLVLTSGRLVGALLFGVSPNDGLLIATAGLVMVLVSLTACLLPALRAAKLDPLVALRTE